MALPPECRCDGSGTYTVTIPIAGAVISDQRQCPVHGATSVWERPLVHDRARGRMGEIMDQRSTSDGVRLDLRPPGGGREWLADPLNLETVQRPGVSRREP